MTFLNRWIGPDQKICIMFLKSFDHFKNGKTNTCEMDVLETVTQLSSTLLFWHGLCNGNVSVLGKVFSSENTRMPKTNNLIIYQLLNAFFLVRVGLGASCLFGIMFLFHGKSSLVCWMQEELSFEHFFELKIQPSLAKLCLIFFPPICVIVTNMIMPDVAEETCFT